MDRCLICFRVVMKPLMLGIGFVKIMPYVRVKTLELSTLYKFEDLSNAKIAIVFTDERYLYIRLAGSLVELASAFYIHII